MKELVFCHQNCSSDREKLLQFEAEGREFAKKLRSLEQWKVRSIFGTAVIRWLRLEFKFPVKIEMALSQMLAIRSWSN